MLIEVGPLPSTTVNASEVYMPVENPTAPARPGYVRSRSMPRLLALDGWRGISIVAVLSAHMLPLGPERFQLNYATGVFGMAIFFCLSGFLITTTLLSDPSVRAFLIRRLCRIVPAAWLYIILVMTVLKASRQVWVAHLLFVENFPPFYLVPLTRGLWSLCVEMQFYIGLGGLALLFKRRWPLLLPFLCLVVTCLRVRAGASTSIVTLYRMDEILSGACLAYLYVNPSSCEKLRAVLGRVNPLLPLVLLALSSHPDIKAMNYVRPYCAAALIGTTLFGRRERWNGILSSRALAYIASISYALYIWHQPMHYGWFESGGKLVKYAKRPLAIGLSFVIAHFSTFYFEQFWIRVGKLATLKLKVPVTSVTGMENGLGEYGVSAVEGPKYNSCR